MKHPRIDLTGRRYGRLSVIRFTYPSPQGWYWVCYCACGQLTTATTKQLQAGARRSCGCSRERTPKPDGAAR